MKKADKNPGFTISGCSVNAESGKAIDPSAVIALANACKANAEAISKAAEALKGTAPGVVHTGIKIGGEQ